MHKARLRIGEILLQMGYITQEQLQEALELQRSTRELLGEVLIRLGYITSEQLAQAQAFQFGVEYERVNLNSIPQDVRNLVPAYLARRLGVLPLRKDKHRLIVAMLNPVDIVARDDLQRITGCYIKPVYTAPEVLQQAIDLFYASDIVHDSLPSTQEESVQLLQPEDYTLEEIDHVEQLVQQAPVVRLVNEILLQAVKMGASDIHFEPKRKGLRLRYRIDGELVEVRNIPLSMMQAVIARVKVLADLNLTERRLPQDGRFSFQVEARRIDVRVSTLPNQHGERVVLRLLNNSQVNYRLDALGFSEVNLQRFRSLIHQPYGMILITGPTGSGKTTTLYATLHQISRPEINIMTCEDPIEYEIEEISQSNVNEKVGLTFATQLRSILRQDPDVVLVGEIRDRETAEIACRASLTGHLVLSTLHTNDAASAIPRLIDMGVEPFLISSSLIGVVGQRLLRRLCTSCRYPDIPSPEERAMLAGDVLQVYRARGCRACLQRGYSGRIAVHEVLLVNEPIRQLILQRAEAGRILTEAVRDGMITMQQDALQKALAGITSLQEVISKVGLPDRYTLEEIPSLAA
ncbi:MAG: type II secretion system protein E [Armatimonadota bacterium]|nr:MAG: type II secretion system protein E [Armatimonadota bacterium]